MPVSCQTSHCPLPTPCLSHWALPCITFTVRTGVYTNLRVVRHPSPTQVHGLWTVNPASGIVGSASWTTEGVPCVYGQRMVQSSNNDGEDQRTLTCMPVCSTSDHWPPWCLLYKMLWCCMVYHKHSKKVHKASLLKQSSHIMWEAIEFAKIDHTYSTTMNTFSSSFHE